MFATTRQSKAGQRCTAAQAYASAHIWAFCSGRYHLTIITHAKMPEIYQHMYKGKLRGMNEY